MILCVAGTINARERSCIASALLERDDQVSSIGVPVMSQRLPGHALNEVARKWCALAARRCAHFLELHTTGRWKHYYSEEEFLLRMREAIRVSERWVEIAGPATSQMQCEPAANSSLRPAA